MSRPHIPDEWGPLNPRSHTIPAPGFDDIVGSIKIATSKWRHLGGFTFNPKTGHVFDVKSRSDGTALFRELVEGDAGLDPSRPIYIIAITCHRGMEADQDLKIGYERASRLVDSPLIGCWFHADTEYLDASFPAQFISDSDAVDVGVHYEQEYIIRIDPDGEASFIQAH